MPSEESMIQDLRELEAELREKEEHRKANIIDLFIRHSTHCKIDKSKIKEKIKELSNEYKMMEQTSDFIIADTIQPKIQVLQELLEEE